MLAKDIMRRDVIAVPPYMTLAELARLFDEKRITGAPVVDGEGKVLGVISQTDLVRAEREAAGGGAPRDQRADDEQSSAGFHYDDPDRTRVEEFMTPGAISFDAAVPVETIARAMLARRVHRVLIVSGGRLRGIVTTMDMLRVLLASRKTAPRTAKARR